MLAAPPPGFNPFSVNRQQVQPYTVPGQQGLTAQGYHPPVPPSLPPGAMLQHLGAANQTAQHPMMRALMGGAR